MTIDPPGAGEPAPPEAAGPEPEAGLPDEAPKRRHLVAAVIAAVVVLGLVVVTVVVALSSGPTGPKDDYAQFDSGIGEKPPPLPPAIPTEVTGPALPVDIAPQLAAPVTRPKPLPAAVSCAYPPDGERRSAKAPAGANIPAQGTVGVSMPTSIGQIGLKLDRALAPCTVNSFLSLAQQGYFNRTYCHRLTTTPTLQVLQCGDPTESGAGGPGYTFADETFPQLKYGRGQIAMANSGPNTNGSQFFMIYGSASGLAPNYTLFGTIAPESLPLLEDVARNGTTDGSRDGAPRTKVKIESVQADRPG
jgi:peptidyl-prolyl cis-trans isomerase B (cyclophilin B)